MLRITSTNQNKKGFARTLRLTLAVATTIAASAALPSLASAFTETDYGTPETRTPSGPWVAHRLITRPASEEASCASPNSTPIAVARTTAPSELSSTVR